MNDSEEIITEFCVYVAGVMLEFSAKIEYTENFLYILPSICSNKILSHSPLYIQFFHEHFLLHSSLNMCLKPHYCWNGLHQNRHLSILVGPWQLDSHCSERKKSNMTRFSELAVKQVSVIVLLQLTSNIVPVLLMTVGGISRLKFSEMLQRV